MCTPVPRRIPSLLPLAWLLVAALAGTPCAAAQDTPAQSEPAPQGAAAVCTVDLANPGMMKDIVSNALLRGIRRPEAEVAAFLQRAETRCPTGDALLRDAARHFGIEAAALAAQVERYRHCNCSHGRLDDTAAAPATAAAAAPATLSKFAGDVALHVVLHELGHALVREFDLPVLGNEETMADAFATHYLVTRLPERALDALLARATSLMIEANEVPRAEWTFAGEHEHDARRAFRIAALAVAADAERYAPVAKVVGMTERDVRSARDYGAEVHRSWRRTLAPLWMPGAERSAEARVVCDAGEPWNRALRAAGLPQDLEAIARGFDWHSQVTIRFVAGDGGAAWSRSQRTVTVHTAYLQRFVAQGEVAPR